MEEKEKLLAEYHPDYREDAFGKISDTGVNSGWNNTIYKVVGEDIFAGRDVYIKGKVTTDDEEGNVYKNMYIQDETSGIEIKLNNSVGINYKKGRWVYVRLNGLYLGNYRMMLSLGGAPSESWNKAGEHKFYGNSNIELQSIIDQHVFAGRDAGEFKVGDYYEWLRYPVNVDIITVTPDNYHTVFDPAMVEFEGKFYGKFQISQRELMFGRLMRFEDLQCRYAGVPSFEFDENGDVVEKLNANEDSYYSYDDMTAVLQLLPDETATIAFHLDDLSKGATFRVLSLVQPNEYSKK